MSKSAVKLTVCALLLYAGSFSSCYFDAHQRQPVPGGVWVSDLDPGGWFKLGVLLLIAAGGCTFAAIRFIYYKSD